MDRPLDATSAAWCQIFKAEKACQKCPGCIKKDGCNEYTWLCFTWDQSAETFSLVRSSQDIVSIPLGLLGLGQVW